MFSDRQHTIIMYLDILKYWSCSLTAPAVTGLSVHTCNAVIMRCTYESETSGSCDWQIATHFSGAPRVLELLRCLTDVIGTCMLVAP
jgi:hypothetical protein